jgi:adenylosuccinate lyase
MGRDKAHELVGQIAQEARRRDVPFREMVSAHREVRRHLAVRDIARVLDYRNYVGLSTSFVDRVLANHRRKSRSRVDKN